MSGKCRHLRYLMQKLVRAAYEKLIQSGWEKATDDAMVVERMTEHPVKLVFGSYENIKITTPEDLEIARSFYQEAPCIERIFRWQ